MLIPRRSLIAAAALAPALPRAAWAQGLAQGAFTHGVASGDPLSDGVVIWTRFVGGDGAIAWEVAEDEAFTRVAQRGQARASAASDFCVKADVRGLAPGRPYFYRFLSGASPSLTGQTRTAPQTANSLTVALVSCANYGFGYFHAYRAIAEREDIDLVIHTGDYIYEYGADAYPRARETVRTFEPAFEIVGLADYYRRYALYHTDPDLLELRRRKPIVAVWDDHEIANDATRTGAQNHQAREGEYVDRVAAATKAYFDWMPIRRPEASGVRVYRSLDWGDLARILLADTRLIGRDRQLDYRTALGFRLLLDGDGTERAVAAFKRTLDDPNRSLLGAEQEAWLADAMAQSAARGQTWQIVAQQVVIGEQLVGAGAARLLPDDAHSNTRRFVAAGERLGRLGMPWNLDAWDGYPAARARFLSACVAHGRNVVALGGDSHNTWLNNLVASGGARLAALEFAGASVTSPGLERALSNAGPGEREALMRGANPGLAWCDLTHRGYGALTFTRTACEAEWVAFDDVRSAAFGAPTTTRFRSEASANAGPGAWVL